mmetsp:Transcript_11364/g.27394  ORF Transcript_11364/g.27394 Transcript_11364/m.27394 type:complete len:248 (+) Transcript_11364:2615-3358(+)
MLASPVNLSTRSSSSNRSLMKIPTRPVPLFPSVDHKLLHWTGISLSFSCSLVCMSEALLIVSDLSNARSAFKPVVSSTSTSSSLFWLPIMCSSESTSACSEVTSISDCATSLPLLRPNSHLSFAFSNLRSSSCFPFCCCLISDDSLISSNTILQTGSRARLSPNSRSPRESKDSLIASRTDRLSTDCQVPRKLSKSCSLKGKVEGIAFPRFLTNTLDGSLWKWKYSLCWRSRPIGNVLIIFRCIAFS